MNARIHPRWRRLGVAAAMAGAGLLMQGCSADVVSFENLPEESNRYTLEVTTGDVTTSWEYDSDRPTEPGTSMTKACMSDLYPNLGTGDCRPEPLIFMKYEFGVGLDATVPANVPHLVTAEAYYEDRLDTPPQVTQLGVEASYDGGETWRNVRTSSTGENTFTFTIRAPRQAAAVSLRVSATDTDGNTVVQTIPEAYRLS